MVIKKNERKTEIKEKMRDGEGSVRITHFVDTENENHTRMLAEITLNKGCSIGYHQHVNETEYFFISSGAGIVNDNGKEVEVSAGDSVVTGNASWHSIKNTGDEPLVLTAVIITYDE
ncbi:MAG: cupin domain-containing protein [Treponema sp.]|nr:cupin domain-containing protein [Treponema sp.]